MRCPACKYPLPDPHGPCRVCGTAPPGPPDNPFEAPRARDAETGPAPYEGPSSIPWEEGYNLPNLLETIKRVTVETTQTFAQAPRDVGLTPALLYSLILGTVFGIIGTGMQAIFLPDGDAVSGPLGGIIDNLARPSVLSALLTPLQVVLGLFLGAAVVHLGLMIVGGANAGFDATFRAIAYTSGSLAPLQLVPVLGPFVGGVWVLVLEILALKELHETSGGKAAFGVLAPLLLVCVAATALVLVAGVTALTGA